MESVFCLRRWTDEWEYYVAVVSFVLHTITFKLDKTNRGYYVAIFGFSLSFLGLLQFQLLGCALVVLGIVLQFIGQQKSQRQQTWMKFDEIHNTFIRESVNTKFSLCSGYDSAEKNI